MFSHCDITAELDLQEISSNSNTIHPDLSNNCTYYEEDALYSEVSEPHIECCKSTKTKYSFSPVGIRQESTLSIDLPPISWHNYESIPKILNVINTGRTILINGHWTKFKPYITGGPLNGNYIFSQIHFHSPSEHEIDGKRYPLEMHVVHYKTCYLTQERAMEEKDGTVVIVYLFQVLNSKKSVLSSITDSIHLIERVNDRTELINTALNQILQPIISNYYIYWGSVSTSKNSYLLQWIISCNNLCVTQNEMDKLKKILCSDESFVENQASPMNIINNIVYHVEEYDSTLEEVKCKVCCNVMPACYGRYRCQNCKLCVIHKEECPQSHITESRPCASKESIKKDKELQTSSCEKTSKATSKMSLCEIKEVKQNKKKKVENAVTSSCSSLNSNSQSSFRENKKKSKKKKDAHKVSSCSSTTKTSNSNDPGDQKQVDFTEPETCSSCPSTEKNFKIKFCAAVKNSEKKDQKTKRKKSPKSETSSCDTLKSISKGSMKSSKILNKKKKIAKNTSEVKFTDSSSKSNKSIKKEKQASKQKKSNKKSESSSAVSSKNSEDVKKEKKKKENKKAENCDVKLEVQCMPILVSTDKKEGLLEVKSNFLEEKKEEMNKLTKEIEDLPVVCKELSQPLKDVETVKTSVCLESNDDIKTIFENKQSVNNSALSGNDYTINFLFAPNSLQKKHSINTSESECLEISKNINSNCSSAMEKSINKIPKSELSSIKSQEQSRDICFETEHFFHTEKKGDFSTCVTQEYNVAVICNHNIIQEFRGTFHPNDLELGMYEKLHLVPKYPDPENVSVRLENCFVKKENLDQLYIRVKFLIQKVNINDTETKTESVLEEEIKAADLEFSNVKNNHRDTVKKENQQQDNITGEKNSNQSDLKSEVSENDECKVVLPKKCKFNSKQSNKSITLDFLQQSSKPVKEIEKEENNLIEQTDKTIKDLFCKRKKVYFSCGKIEKDENSGRKVLVGSFKTKEEMKALSKDQKSAQEIDILTLGEKSLGADRGKFISSSEGSFEELLKAKNPATQQNSKFQSTAKFSKSDKSDESKNLITLHKHKPKNSQVSGNKDERQNFESENPEITVLLEISSVKNKNKSEKPNVGSFSVRPQKLSHDKSQIALTIIPTEKKNFSKTEVISNEHLKNIKKNVEKKEKEYIPCLNCYH